MKKKYGIVRSGFAGEILLQNDTITDAMRSYLKTNPTSYLVKRNRRQHLGYEIVKMFS